MESEEQDQAASNEWNRAMRRATFVFDLMMKWPDDSILEEDDVEVRNRLLNEHDKKLDQAIRENIDHESIWTLLHLFNEMTAHERAANGAYAKLENDPKQNDKNQVKAYWIDWQKNPSRYANKSEFARDMLDKFPVSKNSEGRKSGLASQKVITDKWCKAWEQEAKDDPTLLA